jgi:hypothetical protein
MYYPSNQLLAAAIRVLAACARGGSPESSDVQILNRHALPCQSRLQSAELAGATIWRVRHRARRMKSAA